jgi:hypothetical protein
MTVRAVVDLVILVSGLLQSSITRKEKLKHLIKNSDRSQS